MTPPRWLDTDGRPLPTSPCPRCGAPAPMRRPRLQDLQVIGWPLFRETSYVAWCGHLREWLVLPMDGATARLAPILGEAA